MEISYIFGHLLGLDKDFLAQLLLKKYSTVESSMVEGRHFSGPSPFRLNEEAALLYLSMIIIKGVEQ